MMLVQQIKAISELPQTSVSKLVQAENLSYENEFDLHENKPVGGTQFHMYGFAGRLVLTERLRTTGKWPIS